MTISYQLGYDPIWYIADLVGRPLGGGSMYTYRSLDKTQQKFVFTDPAGNFPWPNPILFDENGQQGPFYFAVDSANPQETYFIEVFDSNGNLVWDVDGYLPAGTGGGGSVTQGINLTNLIINNVFWRNVGVGAMPFSISSTFTLLAPGCHAGLAKTSSNAGPDIVLLKNNTSATEQIAFPFFSLGTQPLNGDVTPVQYLNYTCSLAGSSETQKCIQIPITAKVQNLTNLTVSLTIWARANSGTGTLALQWYTFCGDGAGATSLSPVPIQTLTLTSSWQKFVINATVPDVTGVTLGGCGNDALFLQIQYPFGNTFNIDMTLPSIYLGTITPTNNYILYDQIDGILNVPRTGAIRTTMNSTADLGWVLMNDTTIGNASSNATGRANIDTFPLFNLIWNQVSNGNAQLFNSAGSPISRGSSAVADFTANNAISLPKSLGRALSNIGIPSSGGSGTNWVIGQVFGEENHVLTIPELASHTHTPLSPATSFQGQGTGGTFNIVTQAGSSSPVVNTTGATGGNAGHNTIQPTQYQNFQIKL